MLSLDLARALRKAGVRWDPTPGDAFVIPDRDLDEHVFVVSDMVVQTRPMPNGPPILAFNGTTEWALDSLEAAEALWLPREDQLRHLLGGTFVGLSSTDAGDGEGYVVTLRRPSGETTRHTGATAEETYARALLSLVE